MHVYLYYYIYITALKQFLKKLHISYVHWIKFSLLVSLYTSSFNTKKINELIKLTSLPLMFTMTWWPSNDLRSCYSGRRCRMSRGGSRHPREAGSTLTNLRKTGGTLVSDYRNGLCSEFRWMPLREASIGFHFKWTRLPYHWSNYLEFPGPECCVDSQRASTTQREKTCGDSQTLYFLNEAAWLRRKRGISLHFCLTTSGNHGHASTRLGGCKLLLKQLGEVFPQTNLRAEWGQR